MMLNDEVDYVCDNVSAIFAALFHVILTLHNVLTELFMRKHLVVNLFDVQPLPLG